MAVYSVTYDLKKQGQDYSGLITKLESLNSFKYQQSAWLIKSTLTGTGVSDLLKPFIDTNDWLLVIEVINNKAGWLPKNSWLEINKLFN
ncbi:hypothetical protein [Paenisporosarcina sp. OV554]|uniref:hypothetical protein n=1 Tax=Paenisporosarcina sp. OV554 TaxID=2135694 RepID=UPI000D333DBE|nr:hypothetical protein [Paenisporosarcina sp. OV554]PUB12604.1 hypothetical protein C8K15_109103 [Paenisporosarcina sp. OV554]